MRAAVVKILKGSKEICGFIKEDPRRMGKLVKNESLPAWRREKKEAWRALDTDLQQWLIYQRDKYIDAGLQCHKKLSLVPRARGNDQGDPRGPLIKIISLTRGVHLLYGNFV